MAPVWHAGQCLARGEALVQCWLLLSGCSHLAKRPQSLSISMPSFVLCSEAASGAQIMNCILSLI